MTNIQTLNELHHEELLATLNRVYPIRDRLQETLIETHNEELLDKIILLNKIIKNAEILISREEDVKKFYAENYADYVDESNNINERGINRINFLKKKWKKLGYLNKK